MKWFPKPDTDNPVTAVLLYLGAIAWVMIVAMLVAEVLTFAAG